MNIPVWRVKLQYGRGEMKSEFLVAARNEVEAKKLANRSNVLTAPDECIQARKLSGIIADDTVTEPQTLYKL